MYRNFRIFIVFSLLLVVDFPNSFAQAPVKKNDSKSDSPYVQIDGKKFTLSDVEKEMSREYKQLVQETQERLFRLLLDLGVQKLMSMEAKERNVSLQEYYGQIDKNVSPPTTEELQSLYAGLKQSGQLSESFEDVRTQLGDYILSEKKEEAKQKEIERLKKKFRFVSSREDRSVSEVNIQGEPFRGKADAQITIVEFSDFECPFCRRSQATARQLRAKYGDRIKWVFKDFPLSFHQRAMDAHISANCVHKQSKEKYWTYFDILFTENRTSDILTPDWLDARVKELDLDLSKYKACVADDAIRKEIEEDMAEGVRLGIEGTPTFYINGRKLVGSMPIESFEELLESIR